MHEIPESILREVHPRSMTLPPLPGERVWDRGCGKYSLRQVQSRATREYIASRHTDPNDIKKAVIVTAKCRI